MRIHDDPPLHLTYCLNVHPGETWAENFAAVRDHALRVRDRVCGRDRAFGLGMRLSMRAAGQLAEPAALDDFSAFLRDENLYVFTINGFPYGRFHDTAVKQNVYAPDWRTPERLEYTILLADILAALLPAGVTGSISTVPGSYGQWITDESHVDAMAATLAQAARHLADLRHRTGREICLALEPEPDCYLETAHQAAAFVTGPVMAVGRRVLTADGAMGPEQADDLLRRHIGVCYDTAHAAVAFEDPAEGLARLAREGVRVGKVHLSSAMRLTPTDEALAQLEQFCDEVYLHQVKVRTDDGITSFDDLPQALGEVRLHRIAKPQAAQTPAALRRPLAASQSDSPSTSQSAQPEWRVHFHVPLFFESFGAISSTSSLLTAGLAPAIAAAAIEHVEIETYTFGVLPDDLKPADIVDGLAAEYQWALDNVFASRTP